MALTQISSNGVKDDSIVNADIKSDAAIALSKLASTPAVLTGSTDNTICTVAGANAIQGETNLTFNGTDTLSITGGSQTNSYIKIAADDDRRKTLVFESGGTTRACIGVGDSDEASDATSLFLSANSNLGGASPDVVIDTSGDLKITDGDLVIGTAGHGIDFSANSHASGMSSETLDGYEEGAWTPGVSSGTISGGGFYTRVGNIVHVQMYDTQLGGTRGSETFEITGLPFVPEKWTPGSMYAAIYDAEGVQQATIAVRQDNAVFRVVKWGNEAIATDFGDGYFVGQCTYRIT